MLTISHNQLHLFSRRWNVSEKKMILKKSIVFLLWWKMNHCWLLDKSSFKNKHIFAKLFTRTPTNIVSRLVLWLSYFVSCEESIQRLFWSKSTEHWLTKTLSCSFWELSGKSLSLLYFHHYIIQWCSCNEEWFDCNTWVCWWTACQATIYDSHKSVDWFRILKKTDQRIKKKN